MRRSFVRVCAVASTHFDQPELQKLIANQALLMEELKSTRLQMEKRFESADAKSEERFKAMEVKSEERFKAMEVKSEERFKSIAGDIQVARRETRADLRAMIGFIFAGALFVGGAVNFFHVKLTGDMHNHREWTTATLYQNREANLRDIHQCREAASRDLLECREAASRDLLEHHVHVSQDVSKYQAAAVEAQATATTVRKLVGGWGVVPQQPGGAFTE
jgi:hypothetical protein